MVYAAWATPEQYSQVFQQDFGLSKLVASHHLVRLRRLAAVSDDLRLLHSHLKSVRPPPVMSSLPSVVMRSAVVS